MNEKKSRKQRLKEYHEQLARENIYYQQAVTIDPNVKLYNKSKLKSLLLEKYKRMDFWTKKRIIEARFVHFGSL
jgi:hypothetical protein